jgi:hypothetical protein
MKAYSATYYLTDEQEKHLKEITAKYNEISEELTPERYFALLMLVGSDRIIDSNLALAKMQLDANF